MSLVLGTTESMNIVINFRYNQKYEYCINFFIFILLSGIYYFVVFESMNIIFVVNYLRFKIKYNFHLYITL